MNYSVVRKPPAEGDLADLWVEAPDRHKVAAAADEIDAILRGDPLSAGESRGGDSRILIVPPLAVLYDVSDADKLVTVWGVMRWGRSPMNRSVNQRQPTVMKVIDPAIVTHLRMIVRKHRSVSQALKAMNEYQFTLILSESEESEDDADELYSRFNDGSVITSGGVTRIEFDREAPSLREAKTNKKTRTAQDRAEHYARAAAMPRQWIAEADQEDDAEYD